MNEHQSSRRVNLMADTALEQQRAFHYNDIMLGEKYVEHIPNSIMRGLQRYSNEHIPVGSFLEAVLTNNLCQAITRADPYSLYALPAIVKFIDGFLPAEAYGSQDKYDKWISKK